MKFAKLRVKKKKFSKGGQLVFIKNNGAYFMIDGYHRFMEHYVFDVDVSLFPILIKNNKIKVNEGDFIHYDNFKF